MADNLTIEQRHINMSHIRSINTRPEVIVRKYLFLKGLRYRISVSSLPGCPDIVLKKYRTVIFVNGCFWHHHDCGRFHWPKSNQEYWTKKIRNNEARDKDNRNKLIEMGWNVLTVWECQLSKTKAEKTLELLYSEIIGGNSHSERILEFQDAERERNGSD